MWKILVNIGGEKGGREQQNYYTEQMSSTFCFDKHGGLRRPIAWIVCPECAGGTFAQWSNTVLRHSQPKGLFGTTDREKTLGRSPLPVLDGGPVSQGGSSEPQEKSRVRVQPKTFSAVNCDELGSQCGCCREGGLSVGQFETRRPGVHDGSQGASTNFPVKSPK